MPSHSRRRRVQFTPAVLIVNRALGVYFWWSIARPHYSALKIFSKTTLLERKYADIQISKAYARCWV